MIDEKDPFKIIDKIIERLDPDLKKAAIASLLNKNKEDIIDILTAICGAQAARLREK